MAKTRRRDATCLPQHLPACRYLLPTCRLPPSTLYLPVPVLPYTTAPSLPCRFPCLVGLPTFLPLSIAMACLCILCHSNLFFLCLLWTLAFWSAGSWGGGLVVGCWYMHAAWTGLNWTGRWDTTPALTPVYSLLLLTSGVVMNEPCVSSG